MGSFFLALCLNAYLKMWYWREGYVKECGISPQPIKEENRGYWVTQWLIIRPTFRCFSFKEGGKSQRSPLKPRFTKAFDECTLSLKQLTLQSPSWLVSSWNVLLWSDSIGVTERFWLTLVMASLSNILFAPPAMSCFHLIGPLQTQLWHV